MNIRKMSYDATLWAHDSLDMNRGIGKVQDNSVVMILDEQPRKMVRILCPGGMIGYTFRTFLEDL